MKTLTPQAKALVTVPFEKLKNTKAWKVTSEFVRLSSDGKCYTCGNVYPMKKLNAGHLTEKRGNAAIYFDLDGLRAQCFYCNRRRGGAKDIYLMKLWKEIGYDRVQAYYARAGKSKKWNKLELEEIYEDRKRKVEALEKK